jgi:hypothetical protein
MDMGLIRILFALALFAGLAPAHAQTSGPNPRFESTTIRPPANTTKQGIKTQSTIQGAYTPQVRGFFTGHIANDIVCNDKLATGAGQSGSACVSIFQDAQTGHSGGAFALEAETSVSGLPGVVGDPFWFGVNAIGTIKADIGGTEASPKGIAGGLAGTCIVVAPADWLLGCGAAELRTVVGAGVDVHWRAALIMGSLGAGDVGRGLTVDTQILWTNGIGGAPYRHGIWIAPTSGAHSFDAQSTLIAISPDAGQLPLAGGVDLRNAIMDASTGTPFASDGFRVDGDGDITVKSCTGCSATPPASQIPPPGGRLTLTSGTPVLQVETLGTTVYYTPYAGLYLPIWNGTDWEVFTFLEMSQTLADTTKSPAATVANKNYDLFAWNDAGTLRISRGPAWTDDTTRAAGLFRVGGVLLNIPAITNGPASARGTYLGTIRTNAANQVEWDPGGIGAGGDDAVFGIWNMDNRVNVGALISDTTDSWTLAAAATRAANNSNGMRVSFINGQHEESYRATFRAMFATAAGNIAAIGVGFDITGFFSGQIASQIAASETETGAGGHTTQPAAGWHFFQAIESSQGSGSATFYGDNGTPAFVQNGLEFEGRM